MALDLTIDWATRIITVPRTGMQQIQSDPFEIRELNLNTFRLALKALEAGEEGQVFPDTHLHNPPVAVGGVELARVVEIINDYTVTFEDGQYAANLVGANSNVADRVNLNQVSVRPSNSAGLIQTREIEHASFNDAITIDVNLGVAGTLYPTGTQIRPVNNLADALLIDAVRGFRKLLIISGITFDTGDDVQGLRVHGETMHKSTIVVNTGAQTEGVEFAHATVSGILDGEADLIDCLVGNLSGLVGCFHECMLGGTIVLNGTEPTQLIKCVDALPGSGVPTIDLGGSGRDLGVWGYHGGLKLINKTGADDKVSVNMDSGRLILDSTITAGQILVKGVGLLIDESDGATVDSSGLVNPSTVSDRVWDESAADHTTAGTYGHELATKADIAAASSTDHTAASSGSVIQGDEDAGTYASTAIRDGSYWQVGEDGTTGITVELVFSLPSTDHRPGAVEVFGRYTGSPATVHYQDLWAYNYGSLVWEQLTEEFMPGGMTSDEEHLHEFYERHVDRTNNNEVKIRIIHNVTSYNAAHALHIDSVLLSSHKVITAGDIADAVWDEDLTGHALSDSAGLLIRHILGLTQENMYLKDQVYDENDPPNLLSATMVTYKDAASVGAENNILAEYDITAAYNAQGECISYRSVKV